MWRDALVVCLTAGGGVREDGGATEARSFAVGARRRIFLEWRVERGRGGNGGLRRPGEGVMRSFWCVAGMEREASIEAERSTAVEFSGRVNV